MIHCFVTVAGDYDLLPYFLRHYQKVGVDVFIFNAYEPDRSRYSKIQQVFDEFIRAHPHCQYEPGFWERDKPMDWADRTDRVYEMAKAHPELLNDWCFYPDLDEFVQLPEFYIRDFARMRRPELQMIRGEWFDRLAEGGKLAAINPTKPLAPQYPLLCKVSHTLFHNVSHVVVACRGVAPENHHPDVPAHEGYEKSTVVPVHHFKWRAGLTESMLERAERYRKQGLSNARRLSGMAEYLQRHNKIDLNHPKVRVVGQGLPPLHI